MCFSKLWRVVCQWLTQLQVTRRSSTTGRLVVWFPLVTGRRLQAIDASSPACFHGLRISGAYAEANSWDGETCCLAN